MIKIDLVMVVYRICIMYRNVGHSDTCERAHHSVMLIYVPVLCDLPYSNPFEDVELQISRYLSNLRFLCDHYRYVYHARQVGFCVYQ